MVSNDGMKGKGERETRVPEIRFGGFSEEWEVVKLGEYAKFRRGSFPQPYGNKEWYGGEGSLPFVQVVDVTDKLSLVENTKQKISVIAQPKSIYVEKGKVLVTLQGSIGRVAIAQYDCYVDRTLLIFELFEQETDSYFWAYLIQNKFDTEKKKAPGGTIKTITKEALSAFPIKLSEYKEQAKIGDFFQQLDRLISKHQQKQDKLLNIKKALLEKMFPRSGKTEPEIRFKGFSEEWEEKNFGDSFSNLPNNTLSRSELNDDFGKAKNIHYGDVLIKFSEILNVEEEKIPFVTDENLANKLKHTKLQEGDIIIADAAEDTTVGKCTELVNVREETIFAGLHTIAVRPVLFFSSKYLGYYLNSPVYHNQLLSLIQGTKVSSISKSAIQKTHICFPISQAEQTKIGNLFQQLDRLINQHQTQIQKLNHLKQAFLSKMFV